MVTASELKGALKAHGFRMTPQRQLILEAITSVPGSISADQVYQQVAQRFPDVNITTVYRTFEVLEELGMMSHVHFHEGVARYQLAERGTHQHQHLLCRRCGEDTELDVTVLQPLAAKLLELYDFQPDLAHTAIVGLCGACRAREAHEEASATARCD